MNDRISTRLLNKRICELKLDIDNSIVSTLTARLYKELNKASLANFRPRVYIGDDWFCPENSMLISIPFFLLSPELQSIEKQQIGFIEGGTKAEAMRLLRHEAGHCFFHAYQFSKSLECRRVFGSFKKKYNPDSYRRNPLSKDYVINLQDSYAQSHPEEDFAETFAVFINPRSHWRERYKRWPLALKKLQLMGELIANHRTKKPLIAPGRPLSEAKVLRRTLKRHYQQRLKAISN